MRGAPTEFFISLLWAAAAGTMGAVDPTGGIPFLGGSYDGHPMLYFGQAEVEGLQRDAAGTHRLLAGRIREAAEVMLERPEDYLPPWSPAEFSARWNEVYGNNLGLLAMFCLLYPHRVGALDLARDYMERMAAQPSWYTFCPCSFPALWLFPVSSYPQGQLFHLALNAHKKCSPVNNIPRQCYSSKLVFKHFAVMCS